MTYLNLPVDVNVAEIVLSISGETFRICTQKLLLKKCLKIININKLLIKFASTLMFFHEFFKVKTLILTSKQKTFSKMFFILKNVKFRSVAQLRNKKFSGIFWSVKIENKMISG